MLYNLYERYKYSYNYYIILMILSILITESFCYLNKKSFHEVVKPILYNKLDIYENKLKPKKTTKYLVGKQGPNHFGTF